MKIVKGICSMCHLLCGIDAYVEDGRIVKVTGIKEHPFDKLCPKGCAIPELVHPPERLTNPLRKVNGEFRVVSWDEANANYLTDDMARDPISGYPGIRSVLCRVTRVGP